MESEELNNSRIKTSQNTRTIKLTDFLYIDKEEINKTRNDIQIRDHIYAKDIIQEVSIEDRITSNS